jgi:DNA modification methylase
MKVENDFIKFALDDYNYSKPGTDAQTIIVDPPYNINHNYKSKYKDKLSWIDYENLIYNLLEDCYNHSTNEASLFFINYPEIIFDFYSAFANSSWNVHQLIQWVYPSNIGHSKSKFTRASRTIVWLVKDNPKIYIDRVTQPYKNPNDKRVKKLIESGRSGTHLYDWWEINLVKNVSKDKKNYTNQIPKELLRRCILVTSDYGDLVYDPMCGTGSTLEVAQDLFRFGFGSDINENLVPIWKRIVEEE